jgi:CCR4-NOT transcription complex subunit 1
VRWLRGLRISNCVRRVDRLLDDIRGIRRPATLNHLSSADVVHRPTSVKPETEILREKLVIWFQQWVYILQHSLTPEKSFVTYVNGLSKHGILGQDDVSMFFFRVCIETSVASYAKCASTNDFTYAYQGIDALARMVSYMIKHHTVEGVDEEVAKVHYFTKVLGIIAVVLSHMHEERGPSFPQKPFFRLFSSLLNDLHSFEKSGIASSYLSLLKAIGYVYGSSEDEYR